MTTSILRGKLLPFLLLTGLTGCTSSTPTASTSTAGSGASAGSSTITRSPGDRPGATATRTPVASNPPAPRTASNQPGVGKGHWEVESAPQTGTHIHRRVWVPDDGSGPVTEGGTAVTIHDAPRMSTGLNQANGRGFGEGGR